ncbi:uncharacterized protein LOC126566745 [Anopheles maculipalpis]|uniref:uncharacterized protein LOC126566745 n=1 Tax=Anopheles maculipalpis TaxID=1496333 RepID=UPI0021591F45|nr:uncharacterized protein LOC126566745 [Anopheles maculipalpis]
MEQAINYGIFKLFALMPILENMDCQMWKYFINVCYSLCVIAYIVLQQVIVYNIQLYQDFSGWFISSTVLLTSFVVLVQALAMGNGMQQLLVELMEIDTMLDVDERNHAKRHFSVTFYCMYIVGFGRILFRTILLTYLGLRPLGVALQLIIPSMIVLSRINFQIYLMDLIASQLQTIATELSISLQDDGGRCASDETDTIQQLQCILQRTEYMFGRLQKCLQMVNSLFGWSTAAIVVLVFVGITFQFRISMQPMPFGAPVVEVLYSIILLFGLCRSSSQSVEMVHEIKRILLRPFYNASLWDQINNFIVRTKLEPFVFTANGLYSINYGLFGSTLAASATYIVIMLQFEQKTTDD